MVYLFVQIIIHLQYLQFRFFSIYRGVAFSRISQRTEVLISCSNNYEPITEFYYCSPLRHNPIKRSLVLPVQVGFSSLLIKQTLLPSSIITTTTDKSKSSASALEVTRFRLCVICVIMSGIVMFFQSMVDVILLGKRTPVPTPDVLTEASYMLSSYLDDVTPISYRQFVDVSKPSFALAIIATILPPLVWNIIGPLEYYTHAISSIVRKPIIGVYLSAIIVATLSVFRSAMFTIAMREQPQWNELNDPVIHAVFGVIFVMGLTFFIGAYYRLQITGTYLGDYFGILREERITSFPFSVLDNPMYDGSSIFHFAEAVL